jgi:hypothetical protein
MWGRKVAVEGILVEKIPSVEFYLWRQLNNYVFIWAYGVLELTACNNKQLLIRLNVHNSDNQSVNH